MLLAISLDVTLGSIISAISVFVVGGLWNYIRKYFKKAETSRALVNIKIESIVDAVETSLNGHGEKFRMTYENRKKERWEEHQKEDL